MRRWSVEGFVVFLSGISCDAWIKAFKGLLINEGYLGFSFGSTTLIDSIAYSILETECNNFAFTKLYSLLRGLIAAPS
jgi:hypothetical protein